MARALSRYAALVDSFTDGLDDLRTDGAPRGWTDRIADVSGTSLEFHYANLALRGLPLDAIVDEKVPQAAAMCPDLVTIAAGGNDILGMRVNINRLAAQVRQRGRGADQIRSGHRCLYRVRSPATSCPWAG